MKRKLIISTLVLAALIGGSIVGFKTWFEHWMAQSDVEVIASDKTFTTTAKPEVVEFFFYGCSHCYALEPMLHRWLEDHKDDIHFVRVPAVFGVDLSIPYIPKNPMFMMAKTYYTLEAMGRLDALHDQIFEQVQVEKVNMMSEEALAQYMGRAGVDSTRFKELFESKAIADKVLQARKAMSDYGVRMTPTFIVDGHFRASPRTASWNNVILLKKVEDFVARSRKGPDLPAASANQPAPADLH
jgi:thiol:disulfide interchange protein DsbA